MRAISVLFIVLVISGVLSITRRPMTQTDLVQINKIKSKNSWGSFALNLAEMHLMSEGALQDLVASIADIIKDLEVKTEIANQEWDRRTSQHNTEVRRLNDLITKAKKDIADTQTQLEQVLIPLRTQLVATIAEIHATIDKLNNDIVESNAQRKREAEAAAYKIQGYKDSIPVIDECITYLQPLAAGGEAPALIQLKSAKKLIEKVAKQIKDYRIPEVQFVRALAQLSMQEFANSEAVQNVINKLNEMKTKFAKGIEEEENKEAQAIKDHDAYIIATNQAIADQTNKLNQKTEQLADTEEQIEQAKIFIEQRQADQAQYEKDLDSENKQYDLDQKAYNDLIAQMTSELSDCNYALQIIKEIKIEDYIDKRVSSDKVIDTAHLAEGNSNLPSTYKLPIF